MENVSHILTSLELKAMRECQALIVSCGLDENGAATFGTQVRVILRESITEVTFASSSWLNYYGKDEVRKAFARGRCCVHVDHYQHQESPVTTIIDLLKVGDEVSFDWGIGGYSSQAMESLQVTGDYLYLKVARQVKKDGAKQTKRFTFLLNVCISTDPTTRSIRPR
jgi:hypothetical protein